MRKRMLVVALTLIAAGMWVSREAVAAAQSRDGEAAWLRTESRHFEVHYQPALARDLERVVRSAEAAYERVSGHLAFDLARKVPLVAFAPSGPLMRDAQLDALIVHELTHLLVYEIILPGRGGDGGLPRRVREGIASFMVGAWPDDDERLMRELVASGGVPAISTLIVPRVDKTYDAVFDLTPAEFDAAFRQYVEGRFKP
jgi:hypothetical protein